MTSKVPRREKEGTKMRKQLIESPLAFVRSLFFRPPENPHPNIVEGAQQSRLRSQALIQMVLIINTAFLKQHLNDDLVSEFSGGTKDEDARRDDWPAMEACPQPLDAGLRPLLLLQQSLNSWYQVAEGLSVACPGLHQHIPAAEHFRQERILNFGQLPITNKFQSRRKYN